MNQNTMEKNRNQHLQGLKGCSSYKAAKSFESLMKIGTSKKVEGCRFLVGKPGEENV